MKSEHICFLAGKLWQTQCVEKQRHYSANNGPYSQSYGLPRGHTWLWQLDHKESKVLKNWCLQTVVLEKTPESTLDSKEIKSVNLKGNQPWILIGRTNAEAETSVFWSSDANSWLTGKVHRCNGHELGQTSGDGEGQCGVLQFIGSQRVGHNWVTEQQQQSLKHAYMV